MSRYFPMQKLDLLPTLLIGMDFRKMPDRAWTHPWTRERLASRDGAPWIVMACSLHRQDLAIRP